MKKRKVFVIEYENDPPTVTVLTEAKLQNMLEREFPFHARFKVIEVK